jgi:hypothetical protein
MSFGCRERCPEFQVVWPLEMSHLDFTDLFGLNILESFTENKAVHMMKKHQHLSPVKITSFFCRQFSAGLDQLALLFQSILKYRWRMFNDPSSTQSGKWD